MPLSFFIVHWKLTSIVAENVKDEVLVKENTSHVDVHFMIRNDPIYGTDMKLCVKSCTKLR